MLFHFPVYPQETPIPYPSACFYEGASPITHLLPPLCPGILLHWGIEPSQDQRTLLPLMPKKASYLHAYTLIGDLFPGALGAPVT